MATYIGGGTGSPRSASHSWHHMLKTVFREAPLELKRSAAIRHDIRRIARRKGLR